MKRNIYILFTLLFAAGLTACWNNEIPEAGDARHQIENLISTPGDEQVQLSWSIPEGWNPTDYIVYFTNDDSKTESYRTGGATQYTVTNLTNETQYTFYVQAVYGKLISNYVGATGKPTTSRFPTSDLAADFGDSYITLSWTKPSTEVLSYTLKYYNEDDAEQIYEQTIDKDATEYKLTGLENDKNYYLSLYANYGHGVSDPTTVKAMPSLAIPYTLSSTTAAVGQPITFTFNATGYPTATDVKWIFPGDVEKEGVEVKYGLGSVGTQTVRLSVKLNGVAKVWSLEVEIRQYVVYSTDWAMDGTNYNGFKGSCPVFSPDGKTIYINTFNKIAALYAFDIATGTEKWRYVPQTNSGSYNPATVNPVTGDIYYGTQTGTQFYAVKDNGELRWTFTEAGSMQSCAPAVNAAGTVVYICDKTGNTFAIDATSGSKVWSYAAGVAGCGLLVNGTELLIGAGTNAVFLNISNGTEIAKVALGCEMADITGFAVSADKKLAYFGCKSGYVSAIGLDNHVAKTPLLASANTNYEPVVAPNGTIFFGSKDGSVYNVAADLSVVNWTKATAAGANAYNYSHPCVDTENRFYVTAGQSSNVSYIYDAQGNVIDSWTYEEGNASQKQMAGNNYLDGVFYSAFIGSSTKNGVFVGKYVGGERAATWSTHGGDICGSCCVK